RGARPAPPAAGGARDGGGRSAAAVAAPRRSRRARAWWRRLRAGAAGPARRQPVAGGAAGVRRGAGRARDVRARRAHRLAHAAGAHRRQLRGRLRPAPASRCLAPAASVVCGAAGFASVFLSGALWAWSYERTRSLLPGMIAHMANNAAVGLTLLWLLR